MKVILNTKYINICLEKRPLQITLFVRLSVQSTRRIVIIVSIVILFLGLYILSEETDRQVFCVLDAGLRSISISNLFPHSLSHLIPSS